MLLYFRMIPNFVFIIDLVMISGYFKIEKYKMLSYDSTVALHGSQISRSRSEFLVPESNRHNYNYNAHLWRYPGVKATKATCVRSFCTEFG